MEMYVFKYDKKFIIVLAETEEDAVEIVNDSVGIILRRPLTTDDILTSEDTVLVLKD